MTEQANVTMSTGEGSALPKKSSRTGGRRRGRDRRKGREGRRQSDRSERTRSKKIQERKRRERMLISIYKSGFKE